MPKVTYGRTESLPGYNNVSISIRLKHESAKTALASARAFVLEEIDRELERVGEPARYDTSSSRADLLKAEIEGRPNIDFIVPRGLALPNTDRMQANHRRSYWVRNFPEAVACHSVDGFFAYMDSLSLVGVVTFYRDGILNVTVLQPRDTAAINATTLTWTDKSTAIEDAFSGNHNYVAATPELITWLRRQEEDNEHPF